MIDDAERVYIPGKVNHYVDMYVMLVVSTTFVRSYDDWNTSLWIHGSDGTMMLEMYDLEWDHEPSE